MMRLSFSTHFPMHTLSLSEYMLYVDYSIRFTLSTTMTATTATKTSHQGNEADESETKRLFRILYVHDAVNSCA